MNKYTNHAYGMRGYAWTTWRVKRQKKSNLQPSLVGKHRWNILYEAYQELTTSGGSVDET